MSTKKFFILLSLCLLSVMLIPVKAQLIVKSGAKITVAGDTRLVLSNTDLHIESDNGGDASLIDYNPVIYRNGSKARVGRFLYSNQWHLISSPVAEARAEMFTDDYLMIHDQTTNSWSDVVSVNTPLIPGQGYALWSVDGSASSETFVGTTNSGDVTYSFSSSGSGWNVTGNPYPSAIDWDEVTIPGSLQAAIWVFDPAAGSNGDYKYYIPGGGAANTASQYIASGQAFFINATGGAGELTFTNECRTHHPATFFKAGDSFPLAVLKVTGNESSVQASVRFIDDATSQTDRLYDVELLRASDPATPVLYTTAGSDTLVINTLSDIASHPVVPFWFEAGATGTFTIHNHVEENLEQYRLKLEDVSQGYTQYFNPGDAYQFNHTAGEKRKFNLHFIDATGIADANDTHVSANVVNRQLVVSIPPAILLQNPLGITINVYNILGQRLLSYKAHEPRTTQNISAAENILLVHVTGADENNSFKLFNL
ncbi:MAG: hypothetical protein PHQ65_09530 [Bacteroidales bacterium]|nr:hypothetical protein [Bacteroidales bacterium]MDD3665490.1 hypothetical protein [Bacteroidales bacterium]